MDQDEALRVSRWATTTALDQAGGDPVKADQILLHMMVMNRQIDEAFTIAGSELVEANQANKH